MTTWFTSDTHFWHKQIIAYCNRPVPGIEYGPEHWGANVEKMNAWLIQRWNEKIKPDDTVWHLGDFAFCGVDKAAQILGLLNGKKNWVLGNHDYGLAKKMGISIQFESIQHYKYLQVPINYEDDNGDLQQYHQPIILSHFPFVSWDGMAHGSWHLHGHCHGSLPDNGSLRLDLGVDCWDYYPVSVEEIQNEMALRTVVPVDHHDKRENNPRFKHLLQLKKK